MKRPFKKNYITLLLWSAYLSFVSPLPQYLVCLFFSNSFGNIHVLLHLHLENMLVIRHIFCNKNIETLTNILPAALGDNCWPPQLIVPQFCRSSSCTGTLKTKRGAAFIPDPPRNYTKVELKWVLSWTHPWYISSWVICTMPWMIIPNEQSPTTRLICSFSALHHWMSLPGWFSVLISGCFCCALSFWTPDIHERI